MQNIAADGGTIFRPPAGSLQDSELFAFLTDFDGRLGVWECGAGELGLGAGQLDDATNIEIRAAHFLQAGWKRCEVVGPTRKTVGVGMPLFLQEGVVFTRKVDQARVGLGIARWDFAEIRRFQRRRDIRSLVGGFVSILVKDELGDLPIRASYKR